jgi:AcrR family transcriptional regulator
MAEVADAKPANRFERQRLRNRAVLLEAALELFQAQGIRATKLEEICERADVAQRTFFNHFKTREHLYQAIGRQRAQQFAALIDVQCEDARPFPERLLDLFAPMGRYLAARPAYRELVSEMLHLHLEAGNEVVRSRSLGQAALRFVEDGVARGEISRRHRPEVLADLLLGAITTALTNWSAGPEYDLEVGLEQAARALLDLFVVPNPEPLTP